MKHFRPKERKLKGVGQVPATQAPQPARCWSRCLHMPLAAGPSGFRRHFQGSCRHHCTLPLKSYSFLVVCSCFLVIVRCLERLFRRSETRS